MRIDREMKGVLVPPLQKAYAVRVAWGIACGCQEVTFPGWRVLRTMRWRSQECFRIPLPFTSEKRSMIVRVTSQSYAESRKGAFANGEIGRASCRERV